MVHHSYQAVRPMTQHNIHKERKKKEKSLDSMKCLEFDKAITENS